MKPYERTTMICALSAFTIACFSIVTIAAIQGSDGKIPQDGFAQWAMAAFSFAGTAISLLAVILLRDQMAATRESLRLSAVANEVSAQANEITEKAFQSSIRPWVGRDGDIELHLEAGDPVRVKVNLKNYGESPAVNLRSVVALESGPPTALPPMPLADTSLSTSVHILFPGAAFFASPYGNLPPATENDILMIKAGSRSLWVHGRVEYLSQWGTKHHTAFRYYYKPGYGIIPSEEGNYAT